MDQGEWKALKGSRLNAFPIQVSRRDIPGETKDAQRDRIQQQSKIKVVKMLALVVILFVLSWLPLYTVFAIMKFGELPLFPLTSKCNKFLSSINFPPFSSTTPDFKVANSSLEPRRF
jgi:hypothetical protein